MRKSFRLFTAFFLFFSFFASCFAEGVSKNSDLNIRQGYEAFKNEDWVSAAILLRKAVSSSSNATDENYFMLIKSEIYSGEYKMAEEDCEKFLAKFPLSAYSAHVQYQKGRMLHLLGKNDEAATALSDFCQNHYDDELYPLALYWLAESFYDEYNFDLAKGLYERVVYDFPNSEKVGDCKYKLDLIAQRTREEKLLYLIKVISEENLSTREEYERQLKFYEMQKKYGLSQNQNQNQQVGESQPEQDKKEVAAELSDKNNDVSSKTSPASNVSSASGSSSSSAAQSSQTKSSPASVPAQVPQESAPAAATGSVQIVNEPSLHIRKGNQEMLKKKAKEIPYVIEK